jgi:F-type H+-transporting ATPase subunit alpha
VEQQVLIIFAVTNGYLDDIEVAAVRAWEKSFQDYMAAQHPGIADEIRTKKALSEDCTARLRKAIDQFKAMGSR